MENFFATKLALKEVHDSIFDTPEIIEMYFQTPEDNPIANETTLQNLLASFESESEETISIKIGMIKNMNKSGLDKYEIFYLVNSYINKYFYNIVTYQDEDLLSLIN